jgi:hypothetical protein
MKANKLISDLKMLVHLEGDLELGIELDDDNVYYSAPVYRIEVRKGGVLGPQIVILGVPPK